MIITQKFKIKLLLLHFWFIFNDYCALYVCLSTLYFDFISDSFSRGSFWRAFCVSLQRFWNHFKTLFHGSKAFQKGFKLAPFKSILNVSKAFQTRFKRVFKWSHFETHIRCTWETVRFFNMDKGHKMWISDMVEWTKM